MKKKVKLIVGIILGVIIIASIIAGAFTPLSLETTVLETTTAQVTFTEQGSYQYERSLAVLPQIEGEVLEIKVRPGQTVKKGDTLAVISASDYEYQIKSLESSIAGYNAQISDLYIQEKENKSALNATREILLGQLAEIELNIKDYEYTQESLERQMALQENIIENNYTIANLARKDYRQAREDYDDGLIEQAEYHAARSAYNLAQTSLDSSRQQLEQMQTGTVTKETYETQRKSVEAQLGIVEERMGRSTAYAMSQYYNALIAGVEQNIASMTDKLGQANITAPMDGVISELPVKDANLVSRQNNIATIGSNPVVEVFVPIREIDGVKTGDAVDLIVNKRMGDETIAGTVVVVEEEARIKLSALGVEERKVRVLVKPQTSNLHIGFNMDVKFTVLEQPDSVIVPKTAVFEKDGQDMVWMIENGVIAQRVVEKGIETREGYAITSGLSAGEVVVNDANTEGIAAGKRAKSN